MAGFERFSRWLVLAVAALAWLGVWACLNPETDTFPTAQGPDDNTGAAAGGSGAGGSYIDGAAGSAGSGAGAVPGAAGSSSMGAGGGSAGGPQQPPTEAPDAGPGDAGPTDGGTVSDGG